MKTGRMVCTKTILSMALGVALAGFVPRARAEVASFSYEFDSTNILSGTLDGTLLGDGNTFVVTAIDSLLVDGAAVALPTLLLSADEAFLADDDPAEITLDGSYLNIYATDGTDAFWLTAGNLADYGVAATRGYGGSTDPEVYLQANWQASVAGVPEPSSAALLLVPLGLLAGCQAARKAAGHCVA